MIKNASEVFGAFGGVLELEETLEDLGAFFRSGLG
jgi:hypothetical protein